jgi:hypothetical protein
MTASGRSGQIDDQITSSGSSALTICAQAAAGSGASSRLAAWLERNRP